MEVSFAKNVKTEVSLANWKLKYQFTGVLHLKRKIDKMCKMRCEKLIKMCKKVKIIYIKMCKEVGDGKKSD